MIRQLDLYILFNYNGFKVNNSAHTGQTLIEVIVVIAVGVIVIGALVFATISSLRNAASAKNQSQATKLAQEGLEKVKASRDRNGTITGAGFPANSWVDTNLWNTNISASTCTSPSNCYFSILSSGDLSYLGPYNSPPPVGEAIGNFKRFVILSDDGNFANWKIVEALVTWVDFAGTHESRMKSILRKL